MGASEVPMDIRRFQDRAEAGRLLAAALGQYEGRPDLLVLALPRGGVPVAVPVARRLGAPLDVILVRKLGVPGHEELAMGAIASGGGAVSPSGWRPSSMAVTSARENQRASASSSGSIVMMSSRLSATQPIISEDGKGQGCEAW